MHTSLVVFLIFVATTLAITYWAARRSHGPSAYFAAGRQITAWQNGFAVAGDFMSAASFLGVIGLIALQGFDGFFYSVGGFVAFVTILLLVAEPLRNAGRYTMGDLLAYRLKPRPVRAMATLSTLATIIFYLLAQMVGAGALVTLLFAGSGISYKMGVIGVGTLMILYVVFGGMLATTWVQIIKAIMLLTCAIAITLLVLAQFHFHPLELFSAATHMGHQQLGQTRVSNFLQPGMRYHGSRGAANLISLSCALIFGTAGLPHILVKFYTVPDAATARKSVVWTMALIGSFYIMTSVIGVGATVLVGPDYIVTHGGTNMTALLLARTLAGDTFLAIVSGVAFATILAVVAGLTIGASTSFAHDFWANAIHQGAERKPGETVLVARCAAIAVGIIAIVLAIAMGPNSNAVILATMGMAVAASANFPVIALSIYWRRFNTAGALAGMSTGLIASVALILAGPTFTGIDAQAVAGATHHLFQATPWFPLENPGIISVPLGFAAAIAATMLTSDPDSQKKFNELNVRAQTGLGAEKASPNS